MNADTPRPAPGKGDDASKPPPLTSIGRYQIKRKLGAGGMGTVYLANDPELRRLVALKVLPEDKAQNPTLVKRFRAEAQAAAQLRHDNIVTVFETGEANGLLYIAMEYVDGTDAHQILQKRGPMPLKRSVEVIRQAASALAHAAERNIVHRDIKPSNLMIRKDGVVKLTDLGLARSVDETLETGITRAGTTVGTVDYMAPEQARNSQSADIRSDIYSLGCTWYHLLTARPPYPEGSVTNKLQAHSLQPIPDARELNPAVTDAVVAVLNRMMAKKPADRYATPAELLEDLKRPALTRTGVPDEILDAFADEVDRDDPQGDRDTPVALRLAPPAKPQGRKERPPIDPPEEDDGVPDEAPPIPRRSFDRIPETPAPPARRPRDVEIAEPSDSQAATLPKRRKSRPEESSEVADEVAPAPSPRRKKKVAEDSHLPPRGPVGEDAEVGWDWRPLAKVAVGVLLLAGLFGAAKIAFEQYSHSIAVPDAPKNPFDPDAGPVQPPAATAPNEAGVADENSKEDENSIGAPIVYEDPAAAPKTPPATKNGPPAVSPALVPEWIDREVARGDLPVLTVSRAAGPNRFKTLAEALATVKGEGAVVRLEGEDQHFLPAGSKVTAKRLVLTAESPPARPSLQLLARGQESTGLTVEAQMLEIEGVDVLVDASPAGTAPLNTWINFRGQELRVSDSSFRQTAEDSAAAVAIRWSDAPTGSPKAQTFFEGPRCLLDRVVVLGPALTAAEMVAGRLDAVVRNSLLSTGSRPALRIAAPAQNGPEVPVVARAVRVLHSTITSGSAAVEWAGASSLQTPPGSFLMVRDCVATAPTDADGSTFVRTVNWPEQPVRDSSESRLKGLGVQVTHSILAGHRELVRTGDQQSLRIHDEETWQRFWGKPLADSRVEESGWPASASEPAEPLNAFDPADLPGGTLAASDASPLGAPLDRLPQPELRFQGWAALAATLYPMRQRLDEPMRPGAERPPIVIDLTQGTGDLGTALAKPDLPAEARIEVIGHGIRHVSPVVIRDRRWAITFVSPDDKAPLVLQPKPGFDRDALVEIHGGRVEWSNVSLRGHHSAKGAVCQRWFSVRDGELVLKNVDVGGGWGEAYQPRQLVRLEQTDAARPGFFGLSNCAVVVPHGALEARGPAFHVAIDNSLVASGGPTLGLKFGPGGQRAVADLRHSTVVSDERVVEVASSGGGKLLWNAEESVFAGSGRRSEGAPLVRLNGGSAAATMEWWGRSNGFAAALGPWFTSGDAGESTVPPGDVHAWESLWGKQRIRRQLSGGDGVVFTGRGSDIADGKELKPELFSLDPSCQATRWGSGRRPLGADFQQLAHRGVTKKKIDAAPNRKPIPDPKTPKPNTIRPNF